AGIVFSTAAFAGVYSGGDGSAANPYRIGRADDWVELMNTQGDWGKHFVLLNDIDLSGITLTPVGNSTTMAFIGVFDGNSHVIRNAVVNLPGNDDVGLFGCLHFPGKIRDLGAEDLTITGRRRVGGLVGISNGGEVIGCHAAGSVTGSTAGSSGDIGGLVAFNYFGSIQSSHSAVTVYAPIASGNGSIGGLTGYNWGTIRSCYATGPVTGHGTVGGLVGFNTAGGTIVGCHASGLVTSDYDAGGLVGQNSGVVANSYSTGPIASKWHVGGFVGWNNQGKVFHCYSTGQPTGSSSVGGFCGLPSTGGNYADVGNFWDKDTSLLSGSAMGMGKTTAEMKTKSTFEAAIWDFDETWGINENASYPWLRPVGAGGQTTWSADLNHDGRVDLEDFALFASFWMTGGKIPADLVRIQGGSFTMGDSFGEGDTDELPTHTVSLRTFYMDSREITYQQYCDFLNSALAGGMIFVSGGLVAGTGNNLVYCHTFTSSPESQIDFTGGVFSVRSRNGRSMVNDPMVKVSWHGAAAYCNWRSKQAGRETCYDLSTWVCDFARNGYRLPTEAEWEYAARGGLSGKRFPWGDTITHSQANYESGGTLLYDISSTHGYHPLWMDPDPSSSPVGFFDGMLKYKTLYNWYDSVTSYQTISGANDFGLYDMAGNVMEWCHDRYDGYSSGPQDNPTGPTTGSQRVCRGGSWFNDASECRVAFRAGLAPDLCSLVCGFRLVLGD
ncbi:MAG: formylglycine-generating enzyme family protein, partial [Phycisphaerae bacterium]|nr:formylglycine-generating enzyme family protein [Phycisphaerae bacterium]